MNKWLPVSLFAVFVVALLGATFYLAPSWGLMDDFQNLSMAKEIWSSENPLSKLPAHALGGGVVRPFYFIWAAFVYQMFYHWPAGLYAFIALWNMGALLLWGAVFYHAFCVPRKDYFWTVFFYPLTFFIFTAFWNIFNYLSVQEKFVVFFSAVALYLFQKTYRDLRWQDMALMYVVILCGLLSKATFIFIPVVFLAYAILDLIFFHYRPKTSWIYVVVNAVIFAAYATFIFTSQLKLGYTQRYKENMSGGMFFNKLLHLNNIMKVMLVIGLTGFIAAVVYTIRKKKPEFSMSTLIYMSLTAYVLLLLPWGSQSYLLAATAPMLLGALFPVYHWLIGRNKFIKAVTNAMIAVIVGFIFVGNNVPNISRMADNGKTMAFLREYGKSSVDRDIYFMPPPLEESAYATKNFTGKNVVFVNEGVIKEEMLSSGSDEYILFNDFFPSVHLSGVRIGEEIYANPTWRVFRIYPENGNDMDFGIDFDKTLVQKLKIAIRNL